MRSRAVAAVLTTLLLMPAAASAFTFSRTLCLGDAGTAVANLQQFLVNDDDATFAITSYFGVLTRAAVIHFQAAQGLTATGCTGPLTRAHINTIEAQHPEWMTTLSNGNGYTNVSGAQVRSRIFEQRDPGRLDRCLPRRHVQLQHAQERDLLAPRRRRAVAAVTAYLISFW
jgi:peptidoglycan hydrolase-like protein with peptidoglycan-binding domain